MVVVPKLKHVEVIIKNTTERIHGTLSGDRLEVAETVDNLTDLEHDILLEKLLM